VLREEVCAFAPGRVNLIGEHTDYNDGLALPFAIAQGVTVSARAAGPTGSGPGHVLARALDLDESDEFAVGERAPAGTWRAFVRGVAGELDALGVELPDAELEIHGTIAQGAGLSSSAALEVALALALLGLAGEERGANALAQRDGSLDRRALAGLCARVENEWVGARTGLLDQLASLFGQPDAALLIDFATLAIEPVPLALAPGWRVVLLDAGERRRLAQAGYNERRAECRRACELLGIGSLRELEGGLGPANEHAPLARAGLAERQARVVAEVDAKLPVQLARRVQHVLGENERVRATVAALRGGELAAVGTALNESQASLRELYECSTPAVEATVQRLRQAGALGARMVGGGFGGSVLALFGPDATPPPGAYEVRPSRGARLVG
jgi:galactokinase